MNILLLAAYFPPDTGSAAHLFYELGTALVKKGHGVTVLTSFPSYHARGDLGRYRGKRYIEEEMDGVKVVRVRVPQFPRHIPVGRALWQFSLAFKFGLSTLKLSTFDISIVYSPPPGFYCLVSQEEKRGAFYLQCSRPLSPECHGPKGFEEQGYHQVL